MKTIILLLAMIGLSAGIVSAQEKTSSFKVYGNCGMCKSRIEKAAKTAGISSIDWDTKTKIAKVVYDPSKVTLDSVQKKIALAGHDTELFMAEEKAYSSLPGCCRYERKKMTGDSVSVGHKHLHSQQ